MTGSRKYYHLLSLGMLLCLVVSCLSAPSTTETKAISPAQVVKPAPETSKDVNSRTLNSMMNMDNIKDMFDWSSVTWVPLGQLIFGDKGDGSISIAKWPIGGSSSSNKNSNNNKSN